MIPPITLMQAAREMSEAMMVRRRHIDRARDLLNEDDLKGAVIYVLNCLEHVQQCDERVIRLHAECISLIEYSIKVLQLHESSKPIVIKLDDGG